MKNVIAEYGHKTLYETDKDDEILCTFTNDLIDGRGHVKGSVKNKASINSSIAAHIYKVLAGYHVPTWFKNQKSATELTLKNAELAPVLVTVKNTPNDDSDNVPELTYESIAASSAKAVNVDEIVSAELLSRQDLADIRRYALKINVVLRNLFERRDIELLGFTTQFGYFNGKLVVCSDFTPDTCDLKDAGSRAKYTSTYLISHFDNADDLYEQVQDKILF